MENIGKIFWFRNNFQFFCRVFTPVFIRIIIRIEVFGSWTRWKIIFGQIPAFDDVISKLFQYFLLRFCHFKLGGFTFDCVLRTASLVHGRFVTVTTRSPPSSIYEILIILTSHYMAPHSIGIRTIFTSTITTLACTFVSKIFYDGLVHDESFIKNKSIWMIVAELLSKLELWNEQGV